MSFTNAEIVTTNADQEEYRAALVDRGNPEFVVSSSTLKLFAANPQKWMRGYNPPATKAKRWGSLVDCLLLTPDRFGLAYAVQPTTYEDCVMRCPKCGSETQSKACRKCGVERETEVITKDWNPRAIPCIQWAEGQCSIGKEIITTYEHRDANAAIKRLLEDEAIRTWHDESDKQVWVKADWRDKDTGLVIPCQCLLDYVPRDDSEFAKCAGDLKTVKCAAAGPFTDAAFRYGWHIQAAFDIDMLQAAMPEREFNTWCFIISESYEPWEPNRAIFGQGDDMGFPGFVDLGRESYTRMLRDYARCLKRGEWPGYNMLGEQAQGWAVLRPSKWMVDRGYTPLEQAEATEDAPPESEEVIP